MLITGSCVPSRDGPVILIALSDFALVRMSSIKFVPLALTDTRHISLKYT